MFGEDGFDLGQRDPKAEANVSTLGFVCAFVVFFIALSACVHAGKYTETAWPLYAMYATMCGGGWGIVYYGVRWIERNMAHATEVALVVTAFAVAVIKAAEFVMLWFLTGSEYALEWLALAVNDPVGWLWFFANQ